MTDNREAWRLIRILAALVLAESISSFEGAMIFSAMPHMYADFKDPILVGWTVTTFGLVMVSSTVIGARLGDLFGRKRVLLICLGLAALGSFISAVSTAPWGVIVGRGIQGLSGPLLPLSYSLVREYLPPSRMPMGIGLIAATAIFTGGIAGLVSGVLVDHYHWQSIFYFSTGLSIVALPIVWAVLPPSQPGAASGRIDFLGGIGLIIPVTLLAFAIGKIRSWGWGDPRLLYLALASAVGLALWAWHELRHEQPLIDVRMLLNRRILTANFALVSIGASAMQSAMVVSLLIQQPVATGAGLGLSATVFGSMQFIALSSAIVSGPAAGWLANRYGPRLPLLLGGLIISAVWVIAAIRHDSIELITALLLFNAFGQTLVFAASPILITATVPMERSGEANGMSNIFRQTGMALASQFLSLLLAMYSFTAPEIGSGTYVGPAGFTVVFGFMAAISFLCVVVALSLGKQGAKLAV